METEIENSWKELISSFINFHPTYHLVFEISLILSGLFLYFRTSYKPTEVIQLTKKEEEELISEWKCQPLVPNEWQPDKNIQRRFERPIKTSIGKTVRYVDSDKDLLNFASLNFFDFVGNEDIRESAIKGLRKYGVGSCGPRGFYGTFDAHLKLEEELAEFFHCEEAVVYSFGFSTVASAIPAYSKRGDVIFADEGVHFAIQCGLIASRSKIVWFKHNDISHLTYLLKDQAADEMRNPAKAKVTRKFIVVEGLYMNYGDMCPLPDLIRLKYEYKVRVFVDETVSFGTLGEDGRGICQYYNVDPSDVDLITGSLETSLASCGGFSVGSKYVVDHQRLSGQGYCFSASLPPLQACGASTALRLLSTEQSGPASVARLNQLSRNMTRSCGTLPSPWTLDGHQDSPIKHLRVNCADPVLEEQLLERAVDSAEQLGYLLTLSRYLKGGEHKCPAPSIRIAINNSLSDEELSQFCDALIQITTQQNNLLRPAAAAAAI